MSSHVVIKGNLKILNMELAKKAISDCNLENIKIENSFFVYREEYFERSNEVNRNKDYETVVNKYKELLSELYQKLEIKKLEKLKREEAELKRIEREKKLNIIKENAIKHGYTVKKTINKDNKIQLVLQKRVY